MRREFLPTVEAMPDGSGEDPDDHVRLLQAVIGLRLQGGLEALIAIGALTESEQRRCRSALAAKGISEERVVQQAGGFVLSPVSAAEESGGESDELVSVVAVNRVFGLVDDERCVLTALELWRHSVRGHFLVDVGDRYRVDDERFKRAMERMAESAELHVSDELAGRWPVFPGMRTTWVLDAAGSRWEGRLASGHGGEDHVRLEIMWECALDPSGEVDVRAEVAGQVTGRLTVPL